VELNEICGATAAERRASNNSYHISAVSETFVEQTLFGDGGEAVNIADARNCARQNSPQ
jgi:hypothetical protein